MTWKAQGPSESINFACFNLLSLQRFVTLGPPYAEYLWRDLRPVTPYSQSGTENEETGSLPNIKKG